MNPRRRPSFARLLALAAAVSLSLVIPRPATAATPGMVYIGPTDRPRMALTLDADMTRAMRDAVLAGARVHYDARIIDELRATGTPATLFLTGLWARTYPDATRSFASDPLFELANHSHTHRAFRSPCYSLETLTTASQRRLEVRRARRIIRDITGVTTRYFRFPGGCHSAADVRLVRRLEHVPVQWSLVSGDAYQKNPQVIIDRVLSRARSGAIVVMHLNGEPNAPSTYEALRVIIPELRARGFEFVTLSDLLEGT